MTQSTARKTLTLLLLIALLAVAIPHWLGQIGEIRDARTLRRNCADFRVGITCFYAATATRPPGARWPTLAELNEGTIVFGSPPPANPFVPGDAGRRVIAVSDLPTDRPHGWVYDPDSGMIQPSTEGSRKRYW